MKKNKKLYEILLILYPLIVYYFVKIFFANRMLMIDEYLFITISLTICGIIYLVLKLLNKL